MRIPEWLDVHIRRFKERKVWERYGCQSSAQRDARLGMGTGA
jgi:hypothetical protein